MRKKARSAAQKSHLHHIQDENKENQRTAPLANLEKNKIDKSVYAAHRKALEDMKTQANYQERRFRNERKTNKRRQKQQDAMRAQVDRLKREVLVLQAASKRMHKEAAKVLEGHLIVQR